MKVDYLYIPTFKDIYGFKPKEKVFLDKSSKKLCGRFRKGHFEGVLNVMDRLLALIRSKHIFMGEKDFQQLALIRHMVDDLAMPIQIVGVPTVREESGLAMSSRNGLLTAEERIVAPLLADVMQTIADQVSVDEQANKALVTQATAQLNAAGFKTDAIDIVDADTLASLTTNSQQAVVLMAAFLGKARLIDNKVIKLR